MAPSGPIIWSEGKDTIEADVVFVHGLRGHAIKTWSKDDVCWPRDFLKNDLENARIISWGYDSSVIKPTRRSSQASIFDHCENLLNDLCRLRGSSSESKRPIVFVGHSLGGLLIKETLIRASEYVSHNQHADLGSIYTSTKGVIFLGTPHRGSGKAGLAEILSGIVKIGLQRPNDRLVEVLAEDSQIIARQMKSFTTISQTMPIACVTEEIETGIGMIVPAPSATLQGNTVKVSSVPANHMDMCRFTKSTDIGYQRISHHIITFVRQAARDVQNKFVTDLLQGLAYKEMNDREDQITDAYPETLAWLLPTEKIAGDDELNPRFKEWIKDKTSSLYWLNGKAGSGKSTLMKSVFADPSFRILVEDWARPAKVTFCGFFFFDRGKSMLQKSRNGMMRSLICQIIQKHRELGAIAFPKRYTSWTLHDGPQSYTFDWDWQELSSAFAAILQYRDNNMRLCVFVDGLDEYSSTEDNEFDGNDEDDPITRRIERKTAGHTEIAKIFLDVVRANNVKLCVSSRPLLRFENAFKGVLQMRLQDHTAADIATYVNGRLAQNEMMVDLTRRDPANAEILIDTIVDRASGVFLWVRLVVDLLLDGLEDHDTLIEMQSTVNSLPRELVGRKGLYFRMIEDMKPSFRVQAAKYFRIIQTSRNPLTLLSLSFLETEDIDSILKAPVRQLSQSDAELESKWMQGRLKSRCVGLLEAVPLPPGRKKTLAKLRTYNDRKQSRTMNAKKYSRNQCVEPQIMVQFLHQTAKEFLDQESVWDMVFNQPLLQQFDVNFALLGISIVRLKKVGLDGVDSYDKLVGAWEIIFDALYYRGKLEQNSPNIDQADRLLDDLDAAATILLQDMNCTGEKSSKFSHLHWTDTEPQEAASTMSTLEPGHRTFLTLVAECNLHSYVENKIKYGILNLRSPCGTLLLANAVFPSSQNSRVRAADAGLGFKTEAKTDLAMVELLLKNGADPNEPIPHRPNGDSVWRAILRMEGMLHKDNSEAYASLIKLLIEHGADHSVQVDIGDHMKSALGAVVSLFEKFPEIQTGLVELLEAKGGKWRLDEEEFVSMFRNEKGWERHTIPDYFLPQDRRRDIGYTRRQMISLRLEELFPTGQMPERFKLAIQRKTTYWYDNNDWSDVLERLITEEVESRALRAEIIFHVQRLEKLERKRLDLHNDAMSASGAVARQLEECQP